MGICKTCGKEKQELSTNKNCFECVGNKMRENIKQLQEKKGSHYEKWRRNIIQSALEGRRVGRRAKKPKKDKKIRIQENGG